ncbi:Uncharacterised protein [Vibrio cholerae]|nr:Uncharacterised protein [Vibrio cholerae]
MQIDTKTALQQLVEPITPLFHALGLRQLATQIAERFHKVCELTRQLSAHTLDLVIRSKPLAAKFIQSRFSRHGVTQ